MDGIWQKLKNHPYFKVVAAYLAGGWVLLQIAEILSPALRLPDWVLSAIAVTLIAGFPVVLIIAWIMAKPAVAARGEKLFLDGKYVDYGIAAIAGVLCLFVSFRWFFSETVSTVEVVVAPAVEAPAAVPTSTVVPPTQAPEMSIAVLPFRDMSPNADQAYFSDGVAEEIIFSLARLDELNVTARSSSFAFKDQNMDLKEIARRLGVRYILDGSVRKQDERVRISVQLIDIRNEFSIWSDIFDEELNDIFAVQERISLAVVDNLQLVLGAEDKVRLADRGTRDGDSYEALLQARYIRASSDPAALPDAIDLLNQIVEQDPDFADAWAELGFAN